MDGLRDFIVGVSLMHRPVLLLGARGTGKLLAARKIHAVGRTAQAPFVHVDCSMNSEKDLDEILFDPSGDGVSTGLLFSRSGVSCYLSHIECLTPLLERALLRHVMDERQEGDRCTRVIAGSHYSMTDLIDGQLADLALLEELSRYRTEIPPLRDRVEDIPILCHYKLWLKTPSSRYDEVWESFQSDMLPCLLHYPWPGNINELNQLVESYCDERESVPNSSRDGRDPELDPVEHLTRQFRRWAQEFEREVRSGRWRGWAESGSSDLTAGAGESPSNAGKTGIGGSAETESRWSFG